MKKQLSIEEQERLFIRKNTTKKFSERFCYLQSKADLTNDKMATLLHVSTESIKKYRKLKDATLPEIPLLIDMSTAFDVSVDYLLGLEYDDNPTNFEFFHKFKSMAEKLGFQLREEPGKLTFECTKESTLAFFEQLKTYNGIEADKSVLKNLCNELITKVEYEEIRKKVYLLSHNLELPEYDFSLAELKKAIRQADTYTDTDEYEENGIICYYDEEYGEKYKHWNTTNGNPTQYISDDYYDLFGITKA